MQTIYRPKGRALEYCVFALGEELGRNIYFKDALWVEMGRTVADAE